CVRIHRPPEFDGPQHQEQEQGKDEGELDSRLRALGSYSQPHQVHPQQPPEQFWRPWATARRVRSCPPPMNRPINGVMMRKLWVTVIVYGLSGCQRTLRVMSESLITMFGKRLGLV